MDGEKDKGYLLRLRVLYGLLTLVMLGFLGVLYQAQVVDGMDYYQRSTSQIPTTETVEASRGLLTDRNGKVLVSNRQVYTITFDTSLLEEGEDVNAAVWRLICLCQSYGIQWTDTLPVSREAPFLWETEGSGDTAAGRRTRLQRYLADRGWSEKELTAESACPAWADTEAGRAARERYGDDFSAQALLELMREDFGLDSGYSDGEARLILGVRYELAARELSSSAAAYTFAEAVPTELLAEITDGNYAGVEIGTDSVRQYETDSAAHVLGHIGNIEGYQLEELLAQGYRMDDLVGKSGAELAFESYLRGTDGQRTYTTDEEGRITGEMYSVEPEPGGTVALTLDIDLQEQVERILGEKIEEMNEEDGLDSRGGAAVVIQVGTGDVLALASYPTYSLRTYGQDSAAISSDPAAPLFNRATQGTYAPGSTFKPLTAVAALESGTITPTETILTRGIYTYYASGGYSPRCWIYPGSHGRINVSQAIKESCNYFFYDVGRRTGIDTLVAYARAFGLGEPTGIEIGEASGVMDGPEYRQENGELYMGGDTLQVAIGQGKSLFTPLQLANYIATLVGDGERYEAHLLKNVKSSDGVLLEVYDKGPVETVSMSESTVEAVKKGMGDLVTSGSVSSYFRSCVVSAGAKTGSAQVGTAVANGVFVAFAPFEDPEIALAVVIEKGGSGAALASTAVGIINAYFTSGGGAALTEGTLLP